MERSPAFSSDQVGAVVKAALLYFALVFAAGSLLGAIRVPLLVPRFGVRVAELVEMPVMLVVILCTVHWVVRRFRLPPAPGVRLSVGCIALALLLSAELLLAISLQGISVTQYTATRDPVSGTVYVFMLVLFAVMPSLVRLRRSAASPTFRDKR